ncbi:tetratricopeptide repeat protein, partial [Bordetella bronchiseptica]
QKATREVLEEYAGKNPRFAKVLESWGAFRADQLLCAHGNDRAAAESYRALLARLPNDENAGLNLAIIEARQGRVADARALLERLRQQHPDSRGVRALQEQIGHEQR